MIQTTFATRSWVCRQCRASLRQLRSRTRSNFSSSTRPRQQQQALHSDGKGSVLRLLEERGLINQIAGDRNALDKLLQRKPVGVYAGIDPTAPSLHLGHLLPLMVLFWLYIHGHQTVSLVGGATARVGDPSGRLTSRARTESSVQASNLNALHGQVGRLWERAEAYGQRHGFKAEATWRRRLLNNADWLLNVNVVDFLQLLGSGMRIGAMLGRDTVKNKMEKGDGMSFAEFTYPLLQGWDWWHMYEKYDVQVQVGGSDQYGNIVAGMDAIRSILHNLPGEVDRRTAIEEDSTPMGLTVPLLTTASGEKFGKSAGNALWLDASMTSPFDLYGFLLRCSDEEVERYLKLFTFVPLVDIKALMERHIEDPGRRQAQHLLAAEVIELVHGPEVAAKTRVEHNAMRKPTLAALTRTTATTSHADAAMPAESDDATKRTLLPRSLVEKTPFARVIFHAGLVQTKSEGARLVKSGGLYVVASSDVEVKDAGVEDVKFSQVKDDMPESCHSFRQRGLLILRVGKWRVRVIEAIDDGEFEARRLNAPGWDEWRARHQLS